MLIYETLLSILLKHHILVSDKRAIEDEEFRIAEKFPTMSREDVYDESYRMYTVFVDRCRKYGYEESTEEFQYFYE